MSGARPTVVYAKLVLGGLGVVGAAPAFVWFHGGVRGPAAPLPAAG